MKKLFSCLLAAVLLFSFALTAGADATDSETTGETLATGTEGGESSGESSGETPSTDGSETDGSETGETTQPENQEPVIVPNQNALPDGYEIDPFFSMEITLGAENGWSIILKDLLDEADVNNEYIYFLVEENVAEGYTATYAMNTDEFTRESPGVTAGNVIIVRNVKEGEPPIYQLPSTGGLGSTPYTIAGTVILLMAAVYGVILFRKRKQNAA